MDEIIKKLVRKHKSVCPFTLAQNINIHIRFMDLGESTRGMYYRKLRRRFIVIHHSLPDVWQRFICAHELGHDRLHPGISRFFLDKQSFHNPGKYERQANQFAYKLLTHGAQPMQDESFEDFCRRSYIPVEMVRFFHD